MKLPKTTAKTTGAIDGQDNGGMPGKRPLVQASEARVPEGDEDKESVKGELGKKLLEALSDKLKEAADKLTDVPKGARDAALKELKEADKSCGLSEKGRADVAKAAQRISIYSLAKLLREAALNTRDMADAEGALAHHGNPVDFVKSALGSAKSMGNAISEFNDEMRELQDLVQGAGMNCNEEELKPEHQFKQLIVPAPNYIHIQGGEKGGDHTIQLPKLHTMTTVGGLGVLVGGGGGGSGPTLTLNHSPTISPSSSGASALIA